jgi:hypothetical protein
MLAWPDSNPTPLERLLVDRIVVCWLQLDRLPAKMGSLILRRQTHAHRQFLTAVQTLAIVRPLQPGLVGHEG